MDSPTLESINEVVQAWLEAVVMNAQVKEALNNIAQNQHFCSNGDVYRGYRRAFCSLCRDHYG